MVEANELEGNRTDFDSALEIEKEKELMKFENFAVFGVDFAVVPWVDIDFVPWIAIVAVPEVDIAAAAAAVG